MRLQLPKRGPQIAGLRVLVHLFDQLADGFEFGPVRGLGPFEQDGFGGRDDRAGSFEAAEGEFPIDLVPRRDGIGGDLHLKPEVEQLEGGLGHADVGLDAHQGDVADMSAVELLEELGHRAAVKRGLGRPLRDQFGDGGRGRAEPARVLLGCPRRKAQDLRARISAAALATTFSWSGIRLSSLSCISTARSAA